MSAGRPRDPRARDLSKRFGEKRVSSTGSTLDVDRPAASCSSPGRTDRARRRSCACSPGSTRRPAGELELPRARARRLPRARAARLPRADAAREPPPLRPALRVPERARADRDAARALRAVGGAATSASRPSRAECGSGSALCRVLLHEPTLVVLDEPFNALDAAGAALLDATLDELAPRARARSSPPTIPGASSGSRRDRLAFA